MSSCLRSCICSIISTLWIGMVILLLNWDRRKDLKEIDVLNTIGLLPMFAWVVFVISVNITESHKYVVTCKHYVGIIIHSLIVSAGIFLYYDIQSMVNYITIANAINCILLIMVTGLLLDFGRVYGVKYELRHSVSERSDEDALTDNLL